jgi:hypothetical protein
MEYVDILDGDTDFLWASSYDSQAVVFCILQFYSCCAATSLANSQASFALSHGMMDR